MLKTSLPSIAIVIGAGFAGLATAALLAQYGVAVTVVEKNGAAGGRSESLKIDGFRWDTGPSWYLMPEAFDHFFELLNTSTKQQLDLVDLEPGYRLFPEGEARLDVPANLAGACELFESLEPGAAKQLKRYLASAGESYHLAMEWFLYNNFTSPTTVLNPTVLKRLPKLVSLLSQPLDQFAATSFQDHRLQQMLTYPAVFLASQPATTPALYHLMSHTDLVQGVKYPLGGFHAVVAAMERLALERGVKFRFHRSVVEITTTKTKRRAKATGVRLATGEHLTADIVISTADLHHTETALLPRTLRSYSDKRFANQDQGISAVLVLLGVKGKLPELSHHNLLLSREWETDFDHVFSHNRSLPQASRSVYISMPSATDPTVAPTGHENLFVLIPTAPNPDLGHGDAYQAVADPAVAAIADETIELISQRVGIADLAQRIVIQRSIGPKDFVQRYHSLNGSALGPAHTLRQSAFFRGRNVSRKVAELYYAGATTVPGVGVPMCLISAENILKRLLNDHSGRWLEGQLESGT